MGGGGCEAERGDVVDDGRKAGAGGKEVLEEAAAGVVGSGAEDARRRGEAAAVRTERDVAAGGGRAGADDAAGEVDRSGEGEMECGEGAEEWMLGRVVPNSVSIVGANTAGCVDRSGWRCAGCKGSGHAGWECPGRLYVRFGEACPGFDETGGRRAECWEDGERIGEGTRQAWREYVERHYSPAVRALAEQTGSAFEESGSEDGEGAGDGEMGAGDRKSVV